MPTTHKILVLFAAASSALVAGLAAPVHAAAAATPCWKVLINDWYDGRIDRIYPRHCYREAMAHLPKDVQVYSNARSDIERALQAAILGKKAPPNGGSGGTGTGTGTENKPTTTTSTTPPETPITKALDSFRPAKADSPPIPLFILGGLALLLMAAGAAGVVARRVQARRGEPPA